MDRRAARIASSMNVRRPSRPAVARTVVRAAIPPDDVSPYIPDGFAPDTNEKRGDDSFNLPPTPPDTDEDEREILPGEATERDTDTTAWEPQGGTNGLDYLVPFPGDPKDD